MPYPLLFSSLPIGSVTLPNRVLMAAMSSGLADQRGRVTPTQVGYYRERAQGGVGLVVVEFACVASEYGISESTQLILDNDDAIPGHIELARAIKGGGAVAGIQLQLPGRYAAPRPGLMPVAPSDVPSRTGDGLRARALSSDEVAALVTRFADAARRAVEAGYDVIELHGAHGYLLHAFMSAAMNHRDDAWGGDLERRLAFPRAVISAVKSAIGDRPLLYRFSAEDYMRGGLSLQDMERIAPLLVAAGVDGLDVSTGSLAGSLERTIDPMSKEGWRFELTRRIKQVVDVPVAGIGSRGPERAEQALRDGEADLIALGRPLLADPAWASKAKAQQGQAEAIRPCTSCNWCADRVFKHLPTGCAENPRTGRELVPLLSREVGRCRRIVVVGGGPGGMAAAIQAQSVGFQVTLFEAEPSLGGGLIASAAPPNKQNLMWYRDYLVERLRSSGVEVRVGTRASLDDIVRLDPFAVIQAQGTVPVKLGISGEDLPSVYSAYELLLSREESRAAWQGPAIVYGGGETGCETAELLADRGLQVTLVSRSKTSQLARVAEPLYRKVLLARLHVNPHITLLPETHLSDITLDDVGLDPEGPSGAARLPARMVVLAQGRRANTSMYDGLAARGIPNILIGDAKKIARIGEAVHQANEAIRKLVGAQAEAPPA